MGSKQNSAQAEDLDYAILVGIANGDYPIVYEIHNLKKQQRLGVYDGDEEYTGHFGISYHAKTFAPVRCCAYLASVYLTLWDRDKLPNHLKVINATS